jgi:hypothetical protein
MKNPTQKMTKNKKKKNNIKIKIMSKSPGADQMTNIETQTSTQNIGDYVFVKWITEHWEYVDSSGNQLVGKTYICWYVLFIVWCSYIFDGS